jgi:hypothetical protein
LTPTRPFITDELIALRVRDGSGATQIDRPEGLHRVSVDCGVGRDAIDLLVRPATAISKQPLSDAPGRECHRNGAWAARAIPDTRLGPDADGGDQS